MGRDDAKPLGGLQGGRGPARDFADYMRIAVARRPVERFDTEVVLPEWQLEGDDDAYFGAPEDGGLVDENGMPIELRGAAAPPEGGEPVPPPVDEGPVLDQHWIEEQTERRARAEPSAAPKQTSPAPPALRIPPQLRRAPCREKVWRY